MYTIYCIQIMRQENLIKKENEKPNKKSIRKLYKIHIEFLCKIAYNNFERIKGKVVSVWL